MNEPKITSRPGPKITPNTKYDRDGYPIDHPYTIPVMGPSHIDVPDTNVKILPNGNIAIGDV